MNKSLLYLNLIINLTNYSLLIIYPPSLLLFGTRLPFFALIIVCVYPLHDWIFSLSVPRFVPAIGLVLEGDRTISDVAPH